MVSAPQKKSSLRLTCVRVQRVEEVDRRRTRHFRNLQTAKERRELATEVHTSIGAFEVKLRATQRDLKNQDDDDDDL